jgi:hypothetical protein
MAHTRAQRFDAALLSGRQTLEKENQMEITLQAKLPYQL